MHTRSAYKLKFGTFRAHFSYFDDCQEYNSSYNFMLVGLINIITFPCNGNIAVIVRPFGNDDPIDSIQTLIQNFRLASFCSKGFALKLIGRVMCRVRRLFSYRSFDFVINIQSHASTVGKRSVRSAKSAGWLTDQ